MEVMGLVVAMAIMAMVVYTSGNAIDALQRTGDQVQELEYIRAELYESRVWLEEWTSGDGTVDVDRQVREPLDHAVASCQRLAGAQASDTSGSQEAPSATAITDPAARTAVATVCETLGPVVDLTAARLAAGQTAAGSDLDVAYDAAFAPLQDGLELAGATLRDIAEATRRRTGLVNGVTQVIRAMVLFTFVAFTIRHWRAMHAVTAELEHRSFHDPLTELGNRALLRDRLEEALTQTAAEDRQVALLILDLDGFKAVNDRLGHAAGDHPARPRSRAAPRGRARRRLRGTAGRRRVRGRVQTGVRHRRHDVSDRVLRAFHSPCVINGQAVRIHVSIGMAIGPGAETERADLMRHADLAMYVAKANGGGRAEVFTAAMHATAMERQELERQLPDAISGGQLRVHYQPIVSLAHGHVVKVEALVRWEHPERGLLTPDQFIDIAEQGNLIGKLGEWVLAEACRQVDDWRRHYLQHAELGVAVNVSARQFADDSLLPAVDMALSESGLDPADLTIEVTESSLVDEHARDVLGALAGRGVRLAVDDFGTGYSSLSRLREFVVDELKIDRSFVTDLEGDQDAPMVTSILAMAANLGMTVVAEGIETVDQFAVLRTHGCQLGQGYLFSRPLPPEELARSLGNLTGPAELEAATSSSGRPAGRPENSELAKVVARAVRHDLDLEELVRQLLPVLEGLTGLESTYLTRIDWDRGKRAVQLARNSGALDIPEGMVADFEETICRRVLLGGPRHTADVPAVYGDSAAARGLGLQSYAGVPVVMSDDRIYGTLCGASAASHAISEATMATMDLFARLIAEYLEEVGDDVDVAEALPTRPAPPGWQLRGAPRTAG